MELHREIIKDSYAIKITAQDSDREVGRVRLYVLYNDMHKEPYGLLEDVFVDESERGKGTGTKLVKTAIEEAKKIGCYKVIATVRVSKETTRTWYKKMGFRDYGSELRMDLIK